MVTIAQLPAAPVVPAPSDDKRWRIVSTTMRRHGFAPSALIETLHSVQEAFGYLDDPALVYVARSLKVPLSKTYGVATFYNLFRLKPQGEHACVVCMGTACYIKGGHTLLATVEQCAGIKVSETTPDKKVSLLVARCLGACGIAPAAIFDGQVVGNLTPAAIEERIEEWTGPGPVRPAPAALRLRRGAAPPPGVGGSRRGDPEGTPASEEGGVGHEHDN